MIAAHRDLDPLLNRDVVPVRHHHVRRRPDRQDRDFRRIDDRRELVNPEHAEVGYRERRARVFLRLELPFARALGELAGFSGDLAHPLAVGVENHRDDQSIRCRDGHAQMHSVMLPDLVAEPVRVDLGVLRAVLSHVGRRR